MTIQAYKPTELETVRRNRINLAVWACAYEMFDVSLVSDEEYDRRALELDITTPTGHLILDEFYRTCFSPHTGQWVWGHPELLSLMSRTWYVVVLCGQKYAIADAQIQKRGLKPS